jgi:hypothetical protein
MKKYRVYIQTNKVGSECSDIFEMEDDATEAEIENEAKEIAFNMIEWGFRPVAE